jgi:hypothetical protein
LTATCSSTHRAAYAKFYTFTVTNGATDVVIQMTGTGFTDTYLYLLQGTSFTGTVLYEDDDSGPGFQALIQIPHLPPGSYTIEATSFSAGKLGAFTLDIGGVVIPPVVHPPVNIFESLTITETQKAFFPNVHNFSESLTITEGVTGTKGAPPVGLAESLTITEAMVPTGGTFLVPLSESLTITELSDATEGGEVVVSETLSITEMLLVENVVQIAESLVVTEGATPVASLTVGPQESLSIAEVVALEAIFVESLDDFTLRLTFPTEIRIEDALDLLRYRLRPVDGGVPIRIDRVTPIQRAKVKGVQGVIDDAPPVTGTGVTLGERLTVHESLAIIHRRDLLTITDAESPSLPIHSQFLELRDLPLGFVEVGDYVFFEDSEYNPNVLARVEDVLTPTRLAVDLPFFTSDPRNGQLTWVLSGAVQAVILTISKPTNGKRYELAADDLRKKQTGTLSFHTEFAAVSSQPRVLGIEFEPEEGGVVVTFDQPMRADFALTDPAEYTISGPTSVTVQSVETLDDSSVFLKTIGFGVGFYEVFVNASGTPKDIAGNPLDPSYNAAAFTTSVPLTIRSIFVDRGPISKPPLTIQTGLGVVINDPTTLTLTGGSLSPTVVGLYIILGVSAANSGTFQISAWLSPTQIRVKANLHSPDGMQAATTWEVYDPRNGEIADDPADVVVRINNVITPVLAVIGLLGQIVLAAPPSSTDDVKVDYSYLCNPTVEVRRLNSKEFRLNAWNRDQGYPHDVAGHHYRFNNVLITPSNYTADDMQATLAQPLQRDLKYRAYERAYSALWNDPNLLLFNSPYHHIAYPPLERTVESSFINYLPTVLPEASPAPWERKGAGTANIVFDQLVVGDTTTGPFPSGEPLYWARPIDLTFPAVFAATWQVQINAVTVFEGVWSGLAVGFSDSKKAIVVGYVEVAGVKQVGILKRGFGNDPSQVTAWTGGLSGNTSTGLPADLDWTLLHSFRIFQANGVVRVYFDGEIVENLRVLEDELPFLEELNDPFNQVQNVYFGSLSRPAVNQSTWDFVRYLILPTNPYQTAPSVFVSYEGNDFPETATPPWTPVGYHGNESIVTSSALQVDSTSATDLATEAAVGLVGGDFRGFLRIEPLLAVSSDVILDVNVQLLTETHGITPNAVMAAIDDGKRLLQLCFFPGKAAPKFSYGGRSFPQDFLPTPWTPLGGSAVEMIGRTLRINDTSLTDGRVYFRDDVAGVGTDARIVDATTDWMFEFKCHVRSHTPDPGGFSGVQCSVYDGSRDLGLLFLDIAGVRYVAPHSEGSLLPGPVQFPFEWDDDEPHILRMVKTGGTITVMADGALLGTVPYVNFSGVVGPATGIISWGSSTPISMGATSNVDWFYANIWRVLPSTQKWVGFWKGTDSDSLIGYHLPLTANGVGAAVVGNVLNDPLADFVVAGVLVGDQLVIDNGSNKGVYTIGSVTPTTLTVSSVITFPVQPSIVNYRVPQEVDWTVPHKYRIARVPDGNLTLILDSTPQPLITIGYNELEVPPSSAGVPTVLSGGLPCIAWGAFDPTNLSSTLWDFVRYGITRSPSELRIAPHHQILNQRNVMASPEHLYTSIPHSHTDYWSSSTGIPPQTTPDFFQNPLLVAYTLLNEGTPLVPSTQSTDVQVPTPTTEFVSSFNSIEDLMNFDGDFKFNDGSVRHTLKIPDDVLYTSLVVTEKSVGEQNLITPFCDSCETPDWGTLYWTKEVCLVYDGAVLPENSGNTPAWQLVSDVPANVSATPFSGVLTYATTGPTRTVYRNPTSLPDSLSLVTEVKFRMRVLQDTTLGLGDSQVRLGFSSSAGFTLSLAFVTTPLGERYVLLVDQNTLAVLGGIPFDWYDGAFHDYKLTRDPATASVLISIDS